MDTVFTIVGTVIGVMVGSKLLLNRWPIIDSIREIRKDNTK